MTVPPNYTAFVGDRLLAAGDASKVAAEARHAQAEGVNVLILDDQTGKSVEVDPFSETPAIAGAGKAEEAPAARGRGRPKLGVVPREVTLLPRHWDWLSAQPGGASAALRRLVDEARRGSVQADQARRIQQTVYAAMSPLAGNLAGFEEASRALFAGDWGRFEAAIAGWPKDVADYLLRLSAVDRVD